MRLAIMFSVFIFLSAGISIAQEPVNEDIKGEGAPWKHMRGHHGPPDRPMRNFWQNPEIVDALSITREQVKEFEKLDISLEEKELEIRAEIENAFVLLQKEMRKITPDDNMVFDQAEIIAKGRGDIFKLHLSKQLDAFKILTKEQRDKLKNLHPPTERKMGRR